MYIKCDKLLFLYHCMYMCVDISMLNAAFTAAQITDGAHMIPNKVNGLPRCIRLFYSLYASVVDVLYIGMHQRMKKEGKRCMQSELVKNAFYFFSLLISSSIL